MSKTSFMISQLRMDKASLFAEKYDVLQNRLSQIHAELKDLTISYDDSITNREEIEEILNQELGIKI